ncbi:hypothetical protein F5I97DRAFT_1924525 [Phlebopus sp. FC_14]|nr:hypothetical protein F5I97DRAFT_1924525 [Phlebopus sp. FC_14]
MAGRKRAAEETSAEKRETRSAKVAKTEGTKAAGKAGAKGAARLKTSMPASKFKSRALPLHVNITHTPPTVGEGEEPATGVHADPGFMGSIALVPASFATGSFGWKGSKRVVVELPKAEGEEGEGEKLNVMWTINATVIGSKDVKDEGEEHEAEAEGAPHDEPHETAGESAESKPEEAKEAGAEPATTEEAAAVST